jgi:hypothetical protein
MDCEEPLPEIDTCRDLCNDRSYFLRRLQRHDPKLFNFNVDKSGKYEKYSKTCQDIYQPVVMRHNPETDNKIERDSFTYAIKYGSSPDNQNYYICPKVWCPYCQQPIPFDKVTDIKDRMTLEGKCTIGKCPNGDHEVFIATGKNYEGGKFKSGLYPGFSTKKMHPDGYCLPCCFARNHSNPSSSFYPKFKTCLGEDIEVEGDAKESVRYILGYKSISEDRLGLLSPELSKLFDTNCEQGFIKKSCYLNYGVPYSAKQGFLSAISTIVSEERPITIKELKDVIIDKLNQKIFKTLNGGSLEILFDLTGNKSPLENFKDFLRSDEKIDETYLWDYLSRPGILYEEGLNIIILTEDTILCPYGFNVKDFYSLTKKTIFITKSGNRYTPIYYVKYDDGEMSMQKYFSSVNPIVLRILMILLNNCTQYPSMDWKRILKDNEKKYNIQYDIDLKKEYTLNETIKILDKIKAKAQLIDYYNKVVGILLENGLYLPVLPSTMKEDMDYLLMNEIKLLDYKTLKSSLELIDSKTELNCAPKYKILSDDQKNIVAIILDTGRILPVKPSKLINDRLPVKDIPYYLDANKMIKEDVHMSNKRLETVNRMEYENETYERIRYEFSKYLRLNKNVLEKIKDIIGNKETIESKRKDIEKILSGVIKGLISTKNKTIDFSTYVKPNNRTICFESKDCKDPHCIKDGAKCKLHVYPKNLITGKDNVKVYTEMITEELVRNRMKREDILRDKINDIIDKQKIQEGENEVIFFGRDYTDLEKLAKLYYEDQHIYIKDLEPFDEIEPKFYGIEKKYIELGVKGEDINLESPSGHWQKVLGKDYMIYKTKDGVLFDAISRGINYIDPEGDKITPMMMRERLSDYDVPEDLIMEIANEMKIEVKEESDDDDGDLLLRLYKKYDPKFYKDIDTMPTLKSYIGKMGYDGTLVDIYLLSKLYNVNIVILDHRIKSGQTGMRVIYQPDSQDYIILYTQYQKNRNTYDIVESNGKYVFKKHDFSDRFIAMINEIEEKYLLVKKNDKKNTKKQVKKIKVIKQELPKKRKIRIKK